ncbi:MAG: 50S ribosomal protein L24 [Bacteroidetes bacterium]|jgi:large subunit ribosomal protein L24|nr:50S ribosomal protein L24 [Bacteroidota bacterium]
MKTKKLHSHQGKLKIKKGDQVVVLSGAYKGERGEVLEVIPSDYRAIVEGVNIVKKHQRPTNESEGGIKEIPAPIHMSNLMLVDPSSGEPTRIGRRLEEDQLVRYSKKSGETIK